MDADIKGKTDKRKRHVISALLLAFILFVVIVMAINSRKPGRINLGAVDSHLKGILAP
jgi:hypothetical protein